MPSSRPVLVAAVVVSVLLAGCGSAVDGGATTGPSTDGTPSADGTPGTTEGTLAFYVSDHPAAIDEFDRLTVTVTAVGVHAAAAPDAENSTPSGTTTPNGTETPRMNGTVSVEATDTTSENASAGAAGWITLTVDNKTVDLTELQGANASRITNATLPAGRYNAVYLQVSNVTGVLTSGETVDVKLPSQRLRLNLGFTIGANRTTSFVFDVAVHRAGGSGKYVLRPVIGQSGPDVPIRSVDRERTARPSDAGTPAGQGNPGSGSGGSNGQGGPRTDG